MLRPRDREKHLLASVRWFSRQHPLSEAEERALFARVMTDRGFILCRSCCGGQASYVEQVVVEAEAVAAGMTLVWADEMTLAACPRCVLRSQLLGALYARLQGAQLPLFP